MARAARKPEKLLAGMRALVTSGPTFEPIDPVRFLGNRSSGRQGHAIAAALAKAGAEVTLVSGPVTLKAPQEVRVVQVTTAQEMLDACLKLLPVDVAVCAAAVADWRVKQVAATKLKKTSGAPPMLELVENPDILRRLSQPGRERPQLVIGFAAETEHVLRHARAKLAAKGCDWILANEVSAEKGFDTEDNQVTLITSTGYTAWPRTSKQRIAQKLVKEIENHIQSASSERKRAP